MKKVQIKKTTKNNLITYGIVILAYIVMQILMSQGMVSSLLEGILVPVCAYVILAVSLNLTVGILGELSLGHAGFMCVGAFVGAFTSKCLYSALAQSAMSELLRDSVCFIAALAAGAIVAALCGVLIGIPVLRLRGDYLAIVTLAFGEIIKNIINVIYVGRDADGFQFAVGTFDNISLADGGEKIIWGAQGIKKIPQLSNFTIGIILVLITLFIVLNLIYSRTGRAVMAIRDDRIAAESTGINISKYKLLAFSISAMLAGVAGVLYAHNLTTLAATPKNFGYNMSIMILVYVVLGGIGRIRGSVIAATILVVLPELLRGLDKYRMLVYAIVLIAIMLFTSAPKALELREKYSPKNLFKKKGDAPNGNA